MTKDQWKRRVTKAAKDAGTYEDYFVSVIDTLASILARRDEAEALFVKTGGNVVVNHTNKGGATNIEQNPILRVVNDLNRDALAYWRDLGLTPAGYKRLNLEASQTKAQGGLEELLTKLVSDGG